MTRFIYIVLAFAAAAALLFFPHIAGAAVTDALRFCAYTLIPSLFPFFVLSGILTSCGIGDLFGKLFGRAFERLFRVHGSGAAAFFIGAICGFPGGAKTACELWENSKKNGYGCTASDAENMLAFCCNCGPAYLILGVGSALFGSAAVGVKLWVAQLVSAVLTGILLRGKKEETRQSGPPLLNLKTDVPIDTPVSALREACTATTLICGTVMFFSVICRFASILLAPLPDAVRCTVMSFIEMTSGIRCTAECLPYRQALAVCGFACGWSGLSVHAQTSAVTFGKLRLGKYILGKLLCGVFTTVIMLFI